MKRFLINEVGRVALPPIDLDDPLIVIGSGARAQVRLPAAAATEIHVRIEGDSWTAAGPVIVNGIARNAGERGALAPTGPTVIEVTGYRVEVSTPPLGSQVSAPSRTESLARELVRGMLGTDAAPVLEIESGPQRGSARPLPPPEALVVLGRGDEADWIILDEELSRRHAEVKRGWDGVAIRDLGSKNGTRVDGVAIGDGWTSVADGSRVALGDVVLRFRDPAERHLRGETYVAPTAPTPVPDVTAGADARPAGPPAIGPGAVAHGGTSSQTPFYIAMAVAAAAAAGLVWVLMT